MSHQTNLLLIIVSKLLLIANCCILSELFLTKCFAHYVTNFPIAHAVGKSESKCNNKIYANLI